MIESRICATQKSVSKVEHIWAHFLSLIASIRRPIASSLESSSKKKKKKKQKLPFVRLQQFPVNLPLPSHTINRVCLLSSLLENKGKKERDPQLPLLAYE